MADARPLVAVPSLGARVASALEFIVKVVVVGVPVLYALGRLYLESYWRELHLASSLMDYAAEDYLYFGFLSLVLGLARLIGFEPYTTMAYAALAAVVAAALMVVAALLAKWVGIFFEKQAARFERHIVKWKTLEHSWLMRRAALGVAIVASCFLVVMVTTALALCLLLPIVFAANEGERQARTDRDRLTQRLGNQEASPYWAFAHYENRGVRHTAPLVECGDGWCVVFRNEAFVALPRSDVYRVDSQPRPDQAEN